MVRLSAASRNAIRLALEVGHPDQGVLSLAAVASRTQLSRRYLDRLAAALRQAGLLVGRSGRHGGYRLARPAAEISLAQIVEATAGAPSIVDCVASPARCALAADCPCREVYRALNARLVDALATTSLSELISAARQRPRASWTCPPDPGRGEA